MWFKVICGLLFLISGTKNGKGLKCALFQPNIQVKFQESKIKSRITENEVQLTSYRKRTNY
jgi:hypothetical protein